MSHPDYLNGGPTHDPNVRLTMTDAPPPARPETPDRLFEIRERSYMLEYPMDGYARGDIRYLLDLCASQSSEIARLRERYERAVRTVVNAAMPLEVLAGFPRPREVGPELWDTIHMVIAEVRGFVVDHNAARSSGTGGEGHGTR